MQNYTREIINLYLFGQETTPEDLQDDNFIRPENATTVYESDVNEFMDDGAGRFAVSAQFGLIKGIF